MKGVVYLIFVLINVTFGDKNNVKYGNEDDRKGYLYNPDDHEQIARPCQVYDLNCIRCFFADRSTCSIRKGPVPGEYTLKQFCDYTSRVNITSTPVATLLTGFNNSRVEEFYVNKATNKVVIAIEARDFTISSDMVYLRFFRRGREPITAVTSATLTYISVTLTVVIPNIEDMQFDEAEITSFNSVTSPLFVLGPEIANNPDPTVVQAIAELAQDGRTNQQEFLLTQGPLLAELYIQTNICDFGL